MNSFFSNLTWVLESFDPIKDTIDILAVAFIIYYGIKLVRETRAMQLVKSIGVIFAIYFVAKLTNMLTLTFFLQKILDVGLIVVVVLFQPELRRALERIGRSTLADFGRLSSVAMKQEDVENLIKSIVDGCNLIIAKGDGALIVLERTIRLGDIVNTGTTLDAEPSSELIANIFFKNSPLHDGAMIIRRNRILAAGCFLPLSESDQLSKEMGTRHRAALGVSEVSDSVTIVVSEERGTVSLTMNSQIESGMNTRQLKKRLEEILMSGEDKSKKRGLWKLGDKHGK